MKKNKRDPLTCPRMFQVTGPDLSNKSIDYSPWKPGINSAYCLIGHLFQATDAGMLNYLRPSNLPRAFHSWNGENNLLKKMFWQSYKIDCIITLGFRRLNSKKLPSVKLEIRFLRNDGTPIGCCVVKIKGDGGYGKTTLRNL